MSGEKTYGHGDGFQGFEIGRFHYQYEGGGEPGGMEPASDGEYVRYEDHLRLTQALAGELEAQHSRMNMRIDRLLTGRLNTERFEAAKAAMLGLLSGTTSTAHGYVDLYQACMGGFGYDSKALAQLAVEQADALLEALSGEGGITHEED